MYTNRNPMGFKVLRTWQQANEIFEITEKLAATFPVKHPKTGQYLTDLKDQMIRSARSVVRNIEEGYSRNSTGEYLNFLGFSFGSLEELLGDFEYCASGNIGDHDLAQQGLRLCRGEAKMLCGQMEGLKNKMIQEKTFSEKDQAKMILERQSVEQKRQDEWLANELERIKKEKGQ